MRCIEICLIRVVVFKNAVDLCLLTGMQHNLDQTLLELFQHINILYFCHAKLYVNDSWDLRSIQYIKREQTKTKRSDQYLRL